MTVPRLSNGLPWAWELTGEQLAAFGFPIKHTEKSMGEVHVITEGMTASAARRAAWVAGHCNVGGHQHQPPPVPKPRTVEPDVWAFVQASKAACAAA